MKVIGVGLNKTGTKTLRHHLLNWGFRHRSYELDAFHQFQDGRIQELLDSMEEFDSFEDWPWPLMYREIDKRFPDARFVLTTRRSADAWYKSLCKMAVRMGPLNDYEKHIYGYAMPHGNKKIHTDFYERHNEQVLAHFRNQPNRFLHLCWERGGSAEELASFLGLDDVDTTPQHLNAGMSVYSGDNLWLAHLNRIVFQTRWKCTRFGRRVYRRIRRPVKQNR